MAQMHHPERTNGMIKCAVWEGQCFRVALMKFETRMVQPRFLNHGR
jgi:hypothetical protein